MYLHMKLNKLYNFIAIISCLGVIAWMISDYFGGMILFFAMYFYIVLAIVILYVISIIQTIFSWIINGFIKNRFRIIAHLSVWIFISGISLYESDLFKSKRVVSATLHDDLYHYTLVLRESGECEINTLGFMGYSDQIKGKYFMKNDTIIFTKVPYENDFIPDTVYWNREEQAIFITKDDKGNFSNTKSFLNHFEINSPKNLQ